MDDRMTDPAFPVVSPDDGALEREAASPIWGPLPILLHAHPKNALPPGPLEPEIVEWEQGDFVLHGLKGVLEPDGNVSEFPQELYAWAVTLSYRHLKREGCLEMFGIPVIPMLEREELADAHNALLLAMGLGYAERMGQHFTPEPGLS